MSTGTYTGNDLEITKIEPPRTAKNGKASDFRQFAVRQHADYNTPDGITVEKQPADFYCTTWKPEIISMLNNFKEGDRVDLTGFVEVVWRVYFANNSPAGVVEIIPDMGQSEVEVPAIHVNGKPLVLYPNATPYRMIGQAMNVHVFPGVGLNVQELRPATNLASSSTDTVSADGVNAFAQMQEQQANLNTATAEQPAQQSAQQPQQTKAPANPYQQGQAPFGG